MKIRAKSLFRFTAVLLVLCYAAAHVAIRTEFGRRRALECLSEASGLAVEAGKVRLTAGLSLRLESVSAKTGSGESAATVFSAPEALVSKRCRGVRLAATGAEMRAFKAPDGSWSPAAFAPAAGVEPGIAVFPAVSAGLGKLFLALDGAKLTLDDGSSESVFADLEWQRRPVCLSGHPGAVQNRLSYGSGPVWKAGEDGVLPEGSRATDEWFELHEGTVRFSGAGYPTGPTVFGRMAPQPAATESPAATEPAAESPAAPEPHAESSATPETPAAPEPATESPAAPEPTSESPAAPEPTAESPATPEPPAESPAAPEPTSESPATPEPPAELPATPESPAEFPAPLAEVP